MLFLITDGGIHTADYLWQHGVRPKSITFNLDQLLEDITYGDEETDTVLLVVHGCTTIKYGDVLAIISELQQATNIKGFTIMSNIPINTKRYNPPIEYVYYEGDICGKEVYLRKTNDLNGTSMTKLKTNPLDDFKNENTSEDEVDIGEVVKHYVEPAADSVPIKDIVRIDLFEDKD